ncbi:unnamed protein product [Prorocentrum cordatum]|uniref:Uncharacterized protein n=1 Tax=Prorocentrum cordatum TaxID=2364126 RepID=A0ABN9WRJ2_9DINO|nr:unnamed protein product [Polarella glacialis]
MFTLQHASGALLRQLAHPNSTKGRMPRRLPSRRHKLAKVRRGTGSNLRNYNSQAAGVVLLTCPDGAVNHAHTRRTKTMAPSASSWQIETAPNMASRLHPRGTTFFGWDASLLPVTSPRAGH